VIPDSHNPCGQAVHPTSADRTFSSLKKNELVCDPAAAFQKPSRNVLQVRSIRKRSAFDSRKLHRHECTGGLTWKLWKRWIAGNIFRLCEFYGCYAAIHALKLADAICKSQPKANVVIVCTELCTLHFQKENSIDNITSTLLFADGCAAVYIQEKETILKGITINNFSDVFQGKRICRELSSKDF
jgi:hypothetical protein